METIINSMTLKERRNPDMIKSSRKLRIAKGSGCNANEVSKIIDSFNQMRNQMKNMKNNPNMMRSMMMQAQMMKNKK